MNRPDFITDEDIARWDNNIDNYVWIQVDEIKDIIESNWVLI